MGREQEEQLGTEKDDLSVGLMEFEGGQPAGCVLRSLDKQVGL